MTAMPPSRFFFVSNLYYIAKEDSPKIVTEIIRNKLIRHINVVIVQERLLFPRPQTLCKLGKSAALHYPRITCLCTNSATTAALSSAPFGLDIPTLAKAGTHAMW
ncbi:hypothetical protein K439DRAFT_1619985 [Ramaria rubella]|nr:hypothetical protein K439DRAFT_1619985 [Ramaria rubella]